MSLTLYFVPQTRATRPRWVLEELAVPYELVQLDPSKGETRTEAYRELHPLGHVPALKDGEQVLVESAAICMHLADRFPEKGLAPAPGTAERGRYYQWILFAMTTVEPPLVTIFESRIGRRAHPPEVLAAAEARLKDVGQVVEAALGESPFILGDRFSAADVVLGATLSWGLRMKVLEGFPRISAYAARLMERPAARVAFGGK
jgi:glutathione S-transferase